MHKRSGRRIQAAWWAVCFLALGCSSSALAADYPLVVGQLVTGPKAHVQLTNTGTQAVTAWSLATITPTGEGRTHREVETADGYLSEVTGGLPGSSPRLDRIGPGETRDIELGQLPASAKAELVAVVLDDGTALGDAQLIASIFERRVKERDALRSVVDAFNDVLPNLHGSPALDALRDRLQALVERDGSVPCRAALDAVQTYRAKAGERTADDIDLALRRYAEFVTREYELARKHSQQKAAR